MNPADAERVRVASRFCGPPGRANGGYLAGLIAARFEGPMQITLRRPVPLDTPLITEARGATTLLAHAGEVLAEAVPCELSLDVPEPPDYDAALEASLRYAAIDEHPFPGCFVCGTGREPGDGLRIFAGPVAGRPIVAAPWTPDESLADARSLMPSPIMWAAMDCPGAFAVPPGQVSVPSVLGRISGVVRRRVAAGEPCVVLAWPIARDGRKNHVGTAIADSTGEVCALARAIWFDVDPPHG